MVKHIVWLTVLIPSLAIAIGQYDYTEPITQPVENSARVDQFGMNVEYGANGNPTADTFYAYRIKVFNADGEVVRTINEVIRWSDIPSARQAELRLLHDLSIQHAVSNGLIPAGTAGDDL